MVLENPALHVHTWMYVRYDRINLETAQNQNRNLPISYQNRIFSYIKCHPSLLFDENY